MAMIVMAALVTNAATSAEPELYCIWNRIMTSGTGKYRETINFTLIHSL
jgi:hypothetical protein